MPVMLHVAFNWLESSSDDFTLDMVMIRLCLKQYSVKPELSKTYTKAIVKEKIGKTN